MLGVVEIGATEIERNGKGQLNNEKESNRVLDSLGFEAFDLIWTFAFSAIQMHKTL